MLNDAKNSCIAAATELFFNNEKHKKTNDMHDI